MDLFSFLAFLKPGVPYVGGCAGLRFVMRVFARLDGALCEVNAKGFGVFLRFRAGFSGVPRLHPIGASVLRVQPEQA